MSNYTFLSVLFSVIILIALLVDLFYIRGDKSDIDKIPFKESLVWSVAWVLLALIFNFIIYLKTSDLDKAMEFLAGYLIEKSLSLDNIFVFATIFEYFQVPERYQRKVLIVGILSAVLARAIFIFGGIYLVKKFYFILYVFGVILIYSGIKLFFMKEKERELSQIRIIKFLSNHLPITDRFYGNSLIVRINGKLYLTPLMVVLILIEISDIIFAIDSVPAIFAITLDQFIVYTSNIFAILGLRALYFLLSDLKARFCYLKHGISVILVFVGVKILVSKYINIKPLLSVSLISIIILFSIIASIMNKKEGRDVAT
ncbi:MAG: TerC/Alx family metal homeostasis membrane protein [Thermosulfidibacteraceae bacterium]|jgi:tellurite resistance protein TerC